MKHNKFLALLLSLLVLLALACSFSGTPPEAQPTTDIQATINAAVGITETAQANAQATADAAVTATYTAPPPTATEAPAIPSPTLKPTLEPTQAPTEVLATATSGMAYVKVSNGLSVQLTIKLRGPTPKTFMIAAHSTFDIVILPGVYEFSLSAPGYNPLTGTRTFDPGENTWDIGKAN